MADNEASGTPATGWRGMANRLSATYLRPPKPKSPDADVEPQPATGEQRKTAILNLDKRERQVGLIGAALAGLLALTSTLPGVLNPKNVKVNQTIAASKAHTCLAGFTFDKSTGKCNGKGTYSLAHWEFALILMLVFAVAIFVTTRIGRRAPVGFTALMAGLAFETYVGLLGLPFIAGGGWLLIRAWRVQRYGSPTATKANPSGERRPPPTRAERPTRAKKSRAPEPRGPEPNKRYTPKAPKRKRPAATPPAS